MAAQRVSWPVMGMVIGDDKFNDNDNDNEEYDGGDDMLMSDLSEGSGELVMLMAIKMIVITIMTMKRLMMMMMTMMMVMLMMVVVMVVMMMMT